MGSGLRSISVRASVKPKVTATWLKMYERQQLREGEKPRALQVDGEVLIWVPLVAV